MRSACPWKAAVYSNLALLYDSLMQDVDYRRWAAYLQQLIQRYAAPGRRLLDLGCGTGSLAIELFRAQFDVTGIDLSGEMLAVALNKGLGAGMPADRWRQMDMRDLRFPPAAFDIAICACDGFNYLPDELALQQTLAGLAAVLVPGGLLLFDVHSAYKMEQVFDEGLFVQESELGCCIWSSRYDAASGDCWHEMTLWLRQPDGLYRREEEDHLQHFFPIPTLQAALQENGFQLAAILPWPELSGEVVENTERIQLVAVKQG
jgi:SAM-dependent methyltransferase